MRRRGSLNRAWQTPFQRPHSPLLGCRASRPRASLCTHKEEEEEARGAPHSVSVRSLHPPRCCSLICAPCARSPLLVHFGLEVLIQHLVRREIATAASAQDNAQ